MPLGWVSWRPILTQKHHTRVEIADSDKHSSLSQHEIVYDHKKFYSTGPRWPSLLDWSEGLEIRKVTNWDKKKLRKKGLDKLSDNGYFFKEFTRTGEKPGPFLFRIFLLTLLLSYSGPPFNGNCMLRPYFLSCATLLWMSCEQPRQVYA